MKAVCFSLLLISASVFLSGCGVLGHNLQRLGGAVPNLSSLGNVLKIENHSGDLHPVRIKEGKLQRLGLDE